jgi:16S rRNA (cytidine1402-2'-O)-methyltransferase
VLKGTFGNYKPEHKAQCVTIAHMGTLYIIATPLGNLEDISPRALRILGEVTLIAAEDTRHSGKLLAHFGIKTPLLSYFDHNKFTRLESVLDALGRGDVALISDAGTPGINDPGYELVRAAIERGHIVCPIPGPSAVIAALSASGLPTHNFLYMGYLPRKSAERKHFLAPLAQLPYTLVFLETPHRLDAALADLQDAFGARPIVVAREMTKRYEEFWRGDIPAARAYFSEQPARGELTLVVAGYVPDTSQTEWTEKQVRVALQEGLQAGEAPSALAKRVAHASGWERRVVYQMLKEQK